MRRRRTPALPVRMAVRMAVRVATGLGVWLAVAAGPEAAAEIASGALASVPAAQPGAPPLPADLRGRLARELAARGPEYVPRTRNRRSDGSPRFTNRLLLEASPYLQQHAHNPVNWYPWGDEAFDAARRLGRPVLVSIGYSTCHWCHVMEDESFDDPELARLLNEHFVAVKVDRETRPDIDAIYMAAIHAMGERGGWPLNVWVTPDRRPFFAGTYFPPTDRGGRPGLRRVLNSIREQWATEPARIDAISVRLSETIRKKLEGSAAEATAIPDPQLLHRAASLAASRIDRTWGGASGRIKFPSSVPLRFLLRYHRRTGDAEALTLATLTLEKMAAGGLQDHVGGGFHRYSTDPRWLVPHFEKMLYDNALLVLVYLEAWQITGRDDFRQVARNTLRYVQREMTAPDGAFYSATDADSPTPDGHGEEGLFFTWTPAELGAALDPAQLRAVTAFYAVEAGGNFEGRSILHTPRSLGAVAAQLGISPRELAATLAQARKRLYAVRAERPPPLRDEKILVAWNGLMISAFARAGFALGDPEFTGSARRAAEFVLAKSWDGQRLSRVYQDGRAAGPAFLEDYSFAIAGLLDLYESDPSPRWLRSAIELQAVLDRHYADRAGGGYFKTADDHERLLAREKPSSDGAVPAGSSVAALNLLRLHDWTANPAYLESASLVFSALASALERNPLGLSELLLALDYQLDKAKEIVLVRPDAGAEKEVEAMLAQLRSAFVPNRVLSVVAEGADLEAHASVVPLVTGKVARAGRVTAYVCVNRVCDYPTEKPEVFAQQLGRVDPLE
ncbi:MAG: thioredoxin domain-containing protein [Proteobacteria bacterium]|nr:thioredoxin domain-containing protein [Pseudomonadota bacterium]